jgi:hypothetical protein
MPISKIRSWLSCEPGLGDCTAEARRTRRKEFLIRKYSELCELCITIVQSLRSLRKFSGHCSYVAVLNEKIRPHHEVHEGHDGFRIFQTPNFVIFVSFVVNIFLPIWLRRSRAGFFVFKFAYRLSVAVPPPDRREPGHLPPESVRPESTYRRRATAGARQLCHCRSPATGSYGTD